MTNILLMNKENCALELVDEIILFIYYVFILDTFLQFKICIHYSNKLFKDSKEDKLYGIWYSTRGGDIDRNQTTNVPL